MTTAKLKLSGRIDSNNASETERELIEKIKGADSADIDCGSLEYISSAGLRVLLRIRKSLPGGITLTDVSREVYEIFDMTGFCQMMDVRKAYRVFSVEGCEVIGEGANGIVYRIDGDTIVKVYRQPGMSDMITREIELAKTAFVLGVPTAIPYDVVMIDDGEHYGTVFELLDAESYAKLLISGKKTAAEIAEMTVEVLRDVHAAVPEEGLLPERRDTLRKMAEEIKGLITEEHRVKLLAMLDEMPHDPHMLHGDFHIKNIMVQNGESIIIDMDTLAVGDPVFEFAGIYMAYLGYPEADRNNTMEFFGIEYETAKELYDSILSGYFGGERDAICEADKKIRLLSALMTLFYSTSDEDKDSDFNKKLKDVSIRNLEMLIEEVDALPLRA